MPPKKTLRDEGINFEELMGNPIGRWIVVPVLIAVFVLFGLGLVVGLLWDHPLPPFVFSIPAGVSAAIYYAVQLRKLWKETEDGGDLTLMNRSDGVGKLTASGQAVAPVIKGDNNSVTVTHASAPAERHWEAVEPATKAVSALLVALNDAIDATRANPRGNDDRHYSEAFNRFMETWGYLPKHLWKEDDSPMRKHLDAVWGWRARCKALPPGAPLPPAPKHEDLMDLLLPYVDMSQVIEANSRVK